MRRPKLARVTNTSTHPTDEVKRLVRFAVDETESRSIEVHVKRQHKTYSRYGGWAYHGIPAEANVVPTARWLVTLRLAEADRFPATCIHHSLKNGGPNGDIERVVDWREALVYIAAHEARHIDQFAFRRTWGKGRGEVDAERHARRMLLRYREELCS